MARGIQIVIKQSHYVLGRHDGIRVRMEAIDACEMDAEIFAYRMLPVNPATSETAGHFSHVCSPVDMEEYPKDAPRTGDEPRWFRLAYVDVLLRSTAEVDNFIAAVQSDVNRLLTTLNLMDTLQPQASVTFGEMCAESPSDSESPESSASSQSSQSLGSLQLILATATNERSLGTLGAEWTELEAGGADSPLGDSLWSFAEIKPGQQTAYLYLSGYDFSELPQDAVIEGIEVTLQIGFEEYDGLAGPRLQYLSLHRLEGVTDNLGDNTELEGVGTDIIVGGASALWGKEWTTDQIKRGDFGILLRIDFPLTSDENVTLATIQAQGASIAVFYRL